MGLPGNTNKLYIKQNKLLDESACGGSRGDEGALVAAPGDRSLSPAADLPGCPWSPE